MYLSLPERCCLTINLPAMASSLEWLANLAIQKRKKLSWTADRHESVTWNRNVSPIDRQRFLNFSILMIFSVPRYQRVSAGKRHGRLTKVMAVLVYYNIVLLVVEIKKGQEERKKVACIWAREHLEGGKGRLFLKEKSAIHAFREPYSPPSCIGEAGSFSEDRFCHGNKGRKGKQELRENDETLFLYLC